MKRIRNDEDEEYVKVEVVTGEGVTLKLTLSQTATVLTVKQAVERKEGILSRDACMFVNDEARADELADHETLGSLSNQGKGAALVMSLLVAKADAQEVVPALPAEPDMVLGDGEPGRDDGQVNDPRGVAFVPSHPNWLVVTEFDGHRIKIVDTFKSELICELGNEQEEDAEQEYDERGEDDRYRGDGEGEFSSPWGVAVTSDSSFVLVADYSNQRVQVLRLVVSADEETVDLQFVRYIGGAHGRRTEDDKLHDRCGSGEGDLDNPSSVALLLQEGQDTVLVTEMNNNRISQFKLDGTFVRIFAGTVIEGSGDGELDGPCDITVMDALGEVAVADTFNHRIQVFESDGQYKRQFGSEGKDADGQFSFPSGVASDAHGNMLVTDDTTRLQVFSPEGKHLCTRRDLGLCEGDYKGVAWSATGGLVVGNAPEMQVLLWGT
jgi:DNA-binding beta-propeller fold protein YncE